MVIFFISIDPKNTNFVEDIEILLLVNFVEFCLAVLEERSKIFQPIRGFPIGPNFLEDVEIFLLVKFR